MSRIRIGDGSVQCPDDSCRVCLDTSSYPCYDSISLWFDFYRIFRQSLKLYNMGVLQDGTRAFGIEPDPI